MGQKQTSQGPGKHVGPLLVLLLQEILRPRAFVAYLAARVIAARPSFTAWAAQACVKQAMCVYLDVLLSNSGPGKILFGGL